VELAAQRLVSCRKRLESASPASVLNRGFVIMHGPDGAPVIRKTAVGPGQSLEAEFADGRVKVKAE
jgi:exodeoxyribonuclease VII large subunit